MDSYCSKCGEYHHPSRKESHSKKKPERNCRRKRDSCSPCKIKIITKSNIPGPTGPTGPAGPEGTGHTGPNNTGHTGPDGPQGEIGITLPSTICLNYITEEHPLGLIIGANPKDDTIPPLPKTIANILYVGPIIERTVTLLINILDAGNPNAPPTHGLALTIIEGQCGKDGIRFDPLNPPIGKYTEFAINGTVCITMSVKPTVDNGVWQIGIDNTLLDEIFNPEGFPILPIQGLSVLNLCIN